jgi:predicted DCC family thiol-disulfide oxidoreductase YuxK
VLWDSAYRAIARNRCRLFGRTETCMIPNADLARHILHDE